MIDDASTIVQDATLVTDICVIGGGVAGLTLAMQLRRSGHRILVLEAGGLAAEPESQALYEGEVTDPALHSPPQHYRQRRFGGSTTIWGGRCVPFDPIDFQNRSWIDHAAWPIGYEDVAEYYPEANRLLEAGEYQYDARMVKPGGMRAVLSGFAPANFDTNSIERFSCPTDFGRRYRRQLQDSSTIRILLHSNVTELLTAADGGRVSRAVVKTLAGRRFTVSAEIFVVATGGIEVPRLLLNSTDTHTNGIGNANDLVGRFYMCHIAGSIGRLNITAPRHNLSYGYEMAPDGTYCRRRFALRPERQREKAIGNVVLRLHHPRVPDPAHRTGALSGIYLARHFISHEYGKRLADPNGGGLSVQLRHFANLITDAPGAAAFLAHWFRYRILAARKFPSIIIQTKANLFSLDFHAEQVPNRNSRIGLSRTRDRLGMRKVLVDWRYAQQDIQTVETACKLFTRDIAESGLGTLSLAQDEADFERVVRRDGAYGGHHIGTARMAASQSMGVVDKNCRVFDVSNLFVAGSAVFPTSSQANPTLTIVALTLRLAGHLQREMARPVDVRASRRSDFPLSVAVPD